MTDEELREIVKKHIKNPREVPYLLCALREVAERVREEERQACEDIAKSMVSPIDITEVGEVVLRGKLAEWFFNREADEQEEFDGKNKRIPQTYARWPEDADKQPYCRWAYLRADAFLATFPPAHALAANAERRSQADD